jgi:two-component system cell cycle response regulator DivK
MGNRFALIIEDNVPLGAVYTEALSMANYDSEHIVDGRAALERLRDTVPDLVILDMNLPHVSGHYILKQIRSDERLAQTPVIIVTANTPMAEALSSQLTELDTLLIKPISAQELRDRAKDMYKD